MTALMTILGRAMAAAAMVLLGGGALIVGSRQAEALPSFARQTGQPCAMCHTDFPHLTPYGRRFKLYGYTQSRGSDRIGEPGWTPPLSAQVITSFTHTQSPQSNAGMPPGIAPNSNLILQELSVWYGGAITDHIGLMVQGDYINPVIAGSTAGPGAPGFGLAKHQYNWDMLDLRYADATVLGNSEIVFGATVNNQPGVQDVWNSVPAWHFPFIASTLAPTPAGKTLMEGAWTQRVLGAGAYVFINDMLYIEGSGYRSLSPNQQNSLGIDPTGAPGTLDTVTPYFRVALEPHWGNHWLEFGAFGLLSNVNPQPWNFAGINPLTGSPVGKDHYTDIGFDAQYQYKGANYWFTLCGYYIHEDQQLNASSMLPIDPTGTFGTNPTNQLNSFKATASLVYGTDNLVVFNLTYFNIQGTPDVALYGAGTMANSQFNSPNSNGWIAELAYIPFGMSGPKFYPWLNARIGLQYIWYNKFDGASSNFDGMGTNAKDNNTLFLYAQLTF